MTAIGDVLDEHAAEPPLRSVVIDGEGNAWQRYDADDSAGWESIMWATAQSWKSLVGTHGPVTLLHAPDAPGRVIAMPDEPPVGAVVIEDDGDEWVNVGGVARWRSSGDSDRWFTWDQLLGMTRRLTVVSLPEETS